MVTIIAMMYGYILSPELFELNSMLPWNNILVNKIIGLKGIKKKKRSFRCLGTTIV